MIIDQLPSITIANDSDEIAIEQGTATKKITKQDFLKEVNADIGDVSDLSGFTATDLTGAANELKSNLNGKVSKAGDTITGNLAVKSTNIANGTVPASDTYGNSRFVLYDADGNVLGYLSPEITSNNLVGAMFLARRVVNGTAHTNGITFFIDASGKNTVSFTSPAAWLNALGLAATAFAPTRNTTNTDNGAAYGIYDPGANTVRISGRAQKTGGIPLSLQMFSVPSAYRPSATKNGLCIVNYSGGFGVGGIEVKANGDITQTFSSSTTVMFFYIEYTL